MPVSIGLGQAKQQGQPTPAVSVTSARPHSAAGPLYTLPSR